MEDLHNWHVDNLDNIPCFKKIENEILEKDPYLSYMKNTDEARKVIRNNGKMYYAAWTKVKSKINSYEDLLNVLSK